MKKDDTRYTIRFCPADPRHQAAMKALDAAGRRKASLIADAVCEYLGRHGGVEDINAAYYSSTHIPVKPPYISIPLPSAENAETIVADDTKYAEDNNTDLSETPLFDDDIRQTVLDGLSMFNFNGSSEN